MCLANLEQCGGKWGEWILWLNDQRTFEPIGYTPPSEVEANYCRSSLIRALLWCPDLNQPASTKPGRLKRVS
ncbi:hypothetical protein PS838_01471 [Pseudomonas fluorescens]|nr:hypothetical protein PS838_01471 [Pseudomonas fluorescens]